MTIHFSKHAFDRVRERLGLSSFQVKELFETYKTVPLGIEKKSNRSHDLFFSVNDNACFVAVRDNVDGTIVTIVPAEWHNRWRISIEAMTEAKRLARNEKHKAKPIGNEAPSKLKVRGRIGYKIVNLGSLDKSTFIGALIASTDRDALEIIKANIVKKGLSVSDIDSIEINDGGKSKFLEFYNNKQLCKL